MEEEIIEEVLTEFQRAVHAYRAAGFRDYLTLLDFIDARNRVLKGIDTATDQYRLYDYLSGLDKSGKIGELYDSVMEKFEEKVKCRLGRYLDDEL